YQFAPPAESASVLRYTAKPTGVVSVALARSSLTAAAPLGHGPVPVAPEITLLEQIRLKPWGDGSRDAWTADSHFQVLYDASLSHFSISTRPVVGGVWASDVGVEASAVPFESLEHAASTQTKLMPSNPASLIE